MRIQRLKMGLRAGCVLSLLATLPACQSSEQSLPINRASALVNGTIRVGMSRADVETWLGHPHQTETSGNIEFLFYRSPMIMKIGTSGSNPIAIVDGKVVGTGLIYYYKNRSPNSN